MPETKISTSEISLNPAAAGQSTWSGAPDRTVRPAPRARKSAWLRPGALIVIGFVGLALLFSILAPLLPLQDPNTQDLTSVLAGPSGDHWLGADQLGRDLLSRLVWGTRTSLFAAMTAIAVAAVVGIPLGLIAGYRKGWIDWFLGRFADVVLTVPALVMLITVQSSLKTGIYGQMVVLGILFAPRILRVVRSATDSVVAAPYMAAGRLSGCSHTRILWRYVMPNVREQVLVQISYLLGLALVVETGISFLGIGVQQPDSSLGTLLTGGTAMLASKPMVVLVPAAVLILLILALNMLGDLAVKGKSDE